MFLFQLSLQILETLLVLLSLGVEVTEHGERVSR